MSDLQNRAAELHAAPAIAELAQLDQWVISKPVPRKGKIDKPPFSPILDDQHDEPWMCSHSNPEHWGSYDTARAALRGFSWLGFVFHESDPYSGVDLDGCRDKDTGVIAPWAERIIQMCNSYTEISPSETGVKIWVRGTLPETIKKSFGPHVGIEVYFKQRYFTMTGNHLPGTPLEIRDAQYALDLLWTEYKPAPKAETSATVKRIEKSTPGERAVARDVIARLNAANDLGSLLESKGATLVRTVGDARHYSGLAGDKHGHAITYIVSPAKSGSGHIGYSYSPNGKLNNGDFARGFSWFDAICALDYSGVVIDALKALNPIQPRRRRQEEPAPVDTQYRTQAQTQDAQRKRDARRAEAATTLDAVRARAADDVSLTPCDHAVLDTLLTIAGTRGWCRPSKARIVEMCGYSLGSVKRSLMILEDHGYFTSEGNGGTSNLTAIRTFVRGSFCAPDDPRIDLEYMFSSDSRSCERAPSSPAHENVYADTLDAWQWVADTHGADELAVLEAVEPEAETAKCADLQPEEGKYSVDCVRYDATKRVVWRLWDDTSNQVLGEYASEAEALAAPAETILDMDEIDRWVKEIQAVADARRDERHEPQRYWERHEAQVFREVHPVAPQPLAVYEKHAADNEANRARIRAAWDALGDNPNALGARLGKLRNRLKKYPQSRKALEWQIHELHDRLAALTPVSDVMEPIARGSQARARRAPVALQEVLYGTI